ncbi:MAG: hypothetical protein ACQR33_05615 [Candidatus Saccharibacteria bacterium]
MQEEMTWSPLVHEHGVSILPDGRLGVGEVQEYNALVSEQDVLSLGHGGVVELGDGETFEPFELTKHDVIGAIVRSRRTANGESEITEAYAHVYVQHPNRVSRAFARFLGHQAQAKLSVTYFSDTATYRQLSNDN